MTRPKHTLSVMTKYLGPTNHRGGRVKAVFGNGKSLTVSWDHAVGVYENHAMVAAALAEKLDLGAVDVGSELPVVSKFAYVFLCEVK